MKIVNDATLDSNMFKFLQTSEEVIPEQDDIGCRRIDGSGCEGGSGGGGSDGGEW